MRLRFFDPSSLSLGTKVSPSLFVHRKPWEEAPPALPDKPWLQRRRTLRHGKGGGTRTPIDDFGDRYPTIG